MGYQRVAAAVEALEERAGGDAGRVEPLSRWVARVRGGAARARSARHRELRRVAVLSCALARAEQELVARQRERARRWAELQERLVAPRPPTPEEERRRYEAELWSGDLKGLDGFFKSLDGIKTFDDDNLRCSRSVKGLDAT